MTYLPDADTLNYILKALPPVQERLRQATAAGGSFVLSLVVHYQSTRYLKLKGATRVQQFYANLVSGWLPTTPGTSKVWASRWRIGPYNSSSSARASRRSAVSNPSVNHP
jgi:hypothetical protein